MRIYGDRAENIRIAYIGGGSRGWAWGLMNDLVLEGQLSGEVRLYDIDFSAAYDNERIGNSISKNNGAKSAWSFKAVEKLDDALEGADFVVISILPGTFKEMGSDVHEPEKYGIYQAVGDTTGPGGLVRALRTIPMYVEIAEAIQRVSPEAWVINYTNPMTLCTMTLYEVFPGIKAFGCCHEVFGTQELFVKILKEFRGIEGIARSDIKVNVKGINHFTWIDEAAYSGKSIMDVYGEFVEKYHEPGYEGPSREEEGCFVSGQRVKMDLFKRYKTIAAAGDRHLAEFCPPWYLKNPETVLDWQFRLTPVSYRLKELDERIAKSQRLVKGEEKWELTRTGEEGVALMKALLGLKDVLTNMNLPNRGQLMGIPMSSVVETNAYISKNSIVPLAAGKLPDQVNNLVLRHVHNQQTIMKAAMEKDRELAFMAFVSDPLVNLSLDDARTLFEKMLKNTKQYLPGWDL